MTVVDRVRHRAREFSSNVALRQGDAAWTYGEMFDRVDRISEALRTLGVGKGDCVLAYLANDHAAVELELAVLQSGIVWVTLNARLTWPEVRGVVLACRPKVLVTSAAGRTNVADGLGVAPLDDMPGLAVTGEGMPHGDGSVERPWSFETWVADHAPTPPSVDVGDEDVARLRYTSGTTGGAKAAVLPHRVYQASLDNLLHELPPLGPDDCTLHVAPLTHGGGALLYPTLFSGGTNLLHEHFDVDAVLSAIERDRVSTMFTVPTILSRLVSSEGFDRRDLSGLRSLIYGGAPMPEAQLRQAVVKIGHALLHIYGMTEAPYPITALLQDEHRLDNPRLTSIGKATTVCEVRIVDEAGGEVPPGEIGEIQIRGRNVMSRYHEDPEATAEVLKDGWLSSGDLGRRDDDGYHFIVGRKKDVIISGGFNVYATEVEAALCEYEPVLEAAVVGLPHDDWGELVAAFVVAKAGRHLDATDLDGFARQRLSGYKRPRRVVVVDALPKNSSGKIVKPELVRRYGS